MQRGSRELHAHYKEHFALILNCNLFQSIFFDSVTKPAVRQLASPPFYYPMAHFGMISWVSASRVTPLDSASAWVSHWGRCWLSGCALIPAVLQTMPFACWVAPARIASSDQNLQLRQAVTASVGWTRPSLPALDVGWAKQWKRIYSEMSFVSLEVEE